MKPSARILYAVRLDALDFVALKILAKRKKITRSELVREAIKQIIKSAA